MQNFPMNFAFDRLFTLQNPSLSWSSSLSWILRLVDHISNLGSLQYLKIDFTS
jgi:hypothetical protein